MSRAEQKALEAYPTFNGPCDKFNSFEDGRIMRKVRTAYEEGYNLGIREMFDFVNEFAKTYAFINNGTVNINTFTHDFMKEARQFGV